MSPIIYAEDPGTSSSGPVVSSVSSKIRICHVSMCLTTGGLERLLVEFAKRTDQSKFELMFVALGPSGQPAQEIEALGIPVIRLEEQSSGRWGKLGALRKIFNQYHVDVVHSHNTYAHFYATLSAQISGVPYCINTQHGRGCGNHWKQRLHFWIANRFAHRILAVSEDSARTCRKQDWLSSSRIEPLWNGIDLSRFSYYGPQKKPHAISVARLSPEKDFPTLLKAARKVVDRLPEFQLSIVGDGVERSRLEKLSSELNLNKNVEFLGERHDIPELLRQSAFFVSSTSTEGISLTVLEAMAVGLPIITTRVGGNPEIVADSETGYLVEPGDPEALSSAMLQHLSQQETWDSMGTLARHRIEQQFNIDRMIRDYEALYRGGVSESWSRN